MEESVFGVLYRRIAEHREGLAAYMVSGGPPDYVAYAKAAAQHEAFRIIEEDIKELEKRFMEQ